VLSTNFSPLRRLRRGLIPEFRLFRFNSGQRLLQGYFRIGKRGTGPASYRIGLGLVEGKGLNHSSYYVALCALSAAVSAHAGFTLDLEYEGHGRGSFQNVQVQGDLLWNDATEFSYNWINCSENLWSDLAGDMAITHCIEVHAGISDGMTGFDVVDLAMAPSGGWPGPMGVVRAELMQGLFFDWINPLTGGVAEGPESNALATAFQLVAWEISHERFDATSAQDMAMQMDMSLGAIKWQEQSGAFGVTVDEYVTDMIELLRVGEYGFAAVDGLVSDSAQDQAIYVPTPGVLALLGIGALGNRRRRN